MCAPPSSHSSTAEHPKTLTFASCVGRPKQSEDRAPPLPEELATKLGSGQPLSEGERKIGTLSNSMHLEDGDSDFTCTRACYAVELWVDMADESGTPCESANSLALIAKYSPGKLDRWQAHTAPRTAADARSLLARPAVGSPGGADRRCKQVARSHPAPGAVNRPP